MNLKFIAHTYPTPDFPYFGARIAVEGLGADVTVARCEVDGAWIRDVFVFNDAEECRKGILRAAANHAELRVRTDARQNDRPHILLTFSSGETLALDTPAVGPAAAWPLPEWRYCAAIVLSNTTALDRGAEPVHQPMAVYLDRLVRVLIERGDIAHIRKCAVAVEYPISVFAKLRVLRGQLLIFGSCRNSTVTQVIMKSELVCARAVFGGRGRYDRPARIGRKQLYHAYGKCN